LRVFGGTAAGQISERKHRGNPISITGQKLLDVLPRLKREVIDVEIEVSFKSKP
jgi:hypothetical protein